MVRGKFRLQEITENAWNKSKLLKFGAVCQDETEENRRFHQATPSGTIEMQVNNPAALDQFKIGEEYYVDFTPAKTA